MSPIKGLSDRPLSFPQIGAIKLGRKVKNKNGKEYPQDLNHFLVQMDDQEPKAMSDFLEHYGAFEVTEINVMFPFNDIDRVWDVWLEAYTAGRLWARSDGEIFHYLADPAGGDPLVVNGQDRDGNVKYCDPSEPVGHDYQDKPIYLKPTGRLKVVIPELLRAAYLVLRTSSYHNVINLSSQLKGIEDLVGKIAGVPLVLRRRPREISTPDPKEKGKRVRREKWLVSIEVSPVWMQKQFGTSGLLGLPVGTAVELPEYVQVDDDEDYEDYADEIEQVEGEVMDDLPEVPKSVLSRAGSAWPAETITAVVKANLGFKDENKLREALARSEWLEPTEPVANVKKWASFYVQARKKGDADEAVQYADATLLDLISEEE